VGGAKLSFVVVLPQIFLRGHDRSAQAEEAVLLSLRKTLSELAVLHCFQLLALQSQASLDLNLSQNGHLGVTSSSPR
jgi:hypothetical protein